MMRRIRNVTNETLHVPALGVNIEPGDVATVPDGFDGEFSDAYFEVEEFGDVPAPTPARQPRAPGRPPMGVVNVNALDGASTDEGAR